MIKKLHYLKPPLIFYFFLFISSVNGQNVSETYSNEITHAFADLDKNKVPNGLLLDFAMELTNVEAFNGQLSDSTFVDLETYTNLYHTMLLSRVQNITEGFMLPQNFASIWANLRRDNNFNAPNSEMIPPHLEPPTIVLSGLFYKYSKIRENALSQGDIAVSNNQYQDVIQNGQWQNPYEEQHVFALASPVEEINGQIVSFLFTGRTLVNESISKYLKIRNRVRRWNF